MSRFFIGEGSDTDSSSSDYSDESIDHGSDCESQAASRPFDRIPGQDSRVNRQTGRVVQSVTIKRQNELKDALGSMTSSQSWVEVQKGKRHANGASHESE